MINEIIIQLISAIFSGVITLLTSILLKKFQANKEKKQFRYELENNENFIPIVMSVIFASSYLFFLQIIIEIISLISVVLYLVILSQYSNLDLLNELTKIGSLLDFQIYASYYYEIIISPIVFLLSIPMFIYMSNRLRTKYYPSMILSLFFSKLFILITYWPMIEDYTNLPFQLTIGIIVSFIVILPAIYIARRFSNKSYSRFLFGYFFKKLSNDDQKSLLTLCQEVTIEKMPNNIIKRME